MGAIAGPILGSVAGSVVSGMMNDSGKQSGGTSSKPFNPVNFYTPSGNVTWSGNTGTSTLSPDMSGLRSNYLNQANNYNGILNSFYGPQKSDFYTTTTTAPASGGLDVTDHGIAGGRDFLYNAAKARGQLPGYYQMLADGSMFDGSSKNSKLLKMGSLTSSYSPPSSATQQTFNQSAYDAARASFVSPEQHVYNLLQGLSAPSEQQNRTDLESRLFAQGMLGSADGTGANPQVTALDNAQQQAQLQRELTALTTTPQLMTQYQNLYNSAVGGAQGIDSNLLDLLKTSGNIGVGAGTNSVQGANVQNQINQGAGNFWGSAASGVGNAVNQGVQSLFSPSSSTSYSPFTASNYTSTGGPGVNLSGYDPFSSLSFG